MHLERKQKIVQEFGPKTPGSCLQSVPALASLALWRVYQPGKDIYLPSPPCKSTFGKNDTLFFKKSHLPRAFITADHLHLLENSSLAFMTFLLMLIVPLWPPFL